MAYKLKATVLKVQKPLHSKTSRLQCVFVRCVCGQLCVYVCVKCEWCSCEAAVVLQCNYSLSAAAPASVPALLTLSLWAAGYDGR